MSQPKDRLYSKKLRRLRVLNDIPQKTMALKLDFHSQQNYSKLERGQKHFSMTLIKKICNIFNITTEEFTNVEMEELTEGVQKINPQKEIQYLKNIIELKNELFVYEKIVNLVNKKMLLEKEISLLAEEIGGLMSRKFLYENGLKYTLVEFF